MRQGSGVTLAVAFCLLTPASASAHLPEKFADWQQVARSVFPAACEPEIDAAHTEAPPTPHARAWARSPLLGHDRCEIVLGPRFHPLTPDMQCDVVVHEYGHLAGLPHSDDPASVMRPGRDTVTVPACKTPPWERRFRVGPEERIWRLEREYRPQEITVRRAGRELVRRDGLGCLLAFRDRHAMVRVSTCGPTPRLKVQTRSRTGKRVRVRVEVYDG
ncbi:MAG: matrixin family metalloprotease [Thermoleophilaceae bacterium]